MAVFTVPLLSLAAKMQADLEKVVRKATFDIYTATVLKSPVRTGRFRANWNVSYATPNTSYTGTTDIHRATREVAKVNSLPVGGTVYLTNGLPYAYRLEYEGWSPRAPLGMIRVTALEFDHFVRQAIASLR